MRRRARSRTALFSPLLVGGLALACGGGGSDSPSAPQLTAAVDFVYLQPVAVDPDVDFQACGLEGAFSTHMHPGWVGDPPNTRHGMTAVGASRWELRLDVPVDRDTFVALHDPNSCLTGSPYVPARELSANGVLLGSAPGSARGDEMLFRVSANGVVTLVTG